MDLIQKLRSVDCASVPRFSFDGVETYARVTNVHDPDTITVVFEFNNEMIKMNLRLDGIDAPELRSLVQAEVDVCLKGIETLKAIIEDKVVKVSLGKFDKYGRILARVDTIDPVEGTLLTSINDYLIQYHYVRAYSGGKKGEWTSEELSFAGISDSATKCEPNPKTRRTRRIGV